MRATLDLLRQVQPEPTKSTEGQGAPKKNQGGRPSKASMGTDQDTRPAWMFLRDCFVLEAVERERAKGKNRKAAALAAVLEWKRRFPMGKLSVTEVDNILREYQPEGRPDLALRVIEKTEQMPEFEMVDGKMRLTGRWETKPVLALRFDDRPQYPKRGSGAQHRLKYSKKIDK